MAESLSKQVIMNTMDESTGTTSRMHERIKDLETAMDKNKDIIAELGQEIKQVRSQIARLKRGIIRVDARLRRERAERKAAEDARFTESLRQRTFRARVDIFMRSLASALQTFLRD